MMTNADFEGILNYFGNIKDLSVIDIKLSEETLKDLAIKHNIHSHIDLIVDAYVHEVIIGYLSLAMFKKGSVTNIDLDNAASEASDIKRVLDDLNSE